VHAICTHVASGGYDSKFDSLGDRRTVAGKLEALEGVHATRRCVQALPTMADRSVSVTSAVTLTLLGAVFPRLPLLGTP
jgi:hypothetical protein